MWKTWLYVNTHDLGVHGYGSNGMEHVELCMISYFGQLITSTYYFCVTLSLILNSDKDPPMIHTMDNF